MLRSKADGIFEDMIRRERTCTRLHMGKLCFKNYEVEQMALVELSGPPQQPSQTAWTAAGASRGRHLGAWDGKVPPARAPAGFAALGGGIPFGGGTVANGGGTYIYLYLNGDIRRPRTGAQ